MGGRNRIVVDYGDLDALVFLGMCNNSTGEFTPTHMQDVISAERFTYSTLAEVLLSPERENAEGFVITRISDGEMIKYKYEQYKILHRFMTNTTEKHVWEVITSDQSPEIVFAAAPDEFHEWLHEVITKFYADYQDIYLNVYLAYEKIKRELPADYTRKDFAIAVKAANLPFSSLFFLFEDNDEAKIKNFIWQQLKPKGTKTMRLVSNDAN